MNLLPEAEAAKLIGVGAQQDSDASYIACACMHV